MLESTIEKHLRKRVKELGGFHRKVTYQGRDGSPDDWCFFPGGLLIIIECKAPGEKPRPTQEYEISLLRSYGFTVYVADSKEVVNDILEMLL